MKYIKIKDTDLKVSQIALGCMRIANKSVEEVEQLVFKALDLGINFFDHADIYGKGVSETLFGEVIKRNPGIRDKMIIQTKCSIVSGQRYDFSKDYIINAVKKSLERLNIDTIDVLLLHRPDALADPIQVAEAFKYLKDNNLVRYFGVSNHTANQIKLIEKYTEFKMIFNQLQLSIVHSNIIDSGINMNTNHPLAYDTDGGVLDYCRLNDITIQPWSILQASWEKGCFLDHPDYQELNDKLNELAIKYQVSKAAIAVAWILKHPANMQPIAGTTSPKNLEDLVSAIDINLTNQEWYDLYRASGKILP